LLYASMADVLSSVLIKARRYPLKRIFKIVFIAWIPKNIPISVPTRFNRNAYSPSGNPVIADTKPTKKPKHIGAGSVHTNIRQNQLHHNFAAYFQVTVISSIFNHTFLLK